MTVTRTITQRQRNAVPFIFMPLKFVFVFLPWITTKRQLGKPKGSLKMIKMEKKYIYKAIGC